MIDTHAHLNFPELLSNLDNIINQSKQNQLKAIIVVSSNLKDSAKAVELAQKYPNYLYASVGIHPQKTNPENKQSIKDQIKQLKQLIKDNSCVVAIGETGLDFSSPLLDEEERSRQEQFELFQQQINLAQEFSLPLIIHARGSNDEICQILQTKTRLGGVFHCYSGGKKRVNKILALAGNWYFGIDGNVTYDQGLQNVVKLIPKDKLVLETDSPYLAPEPYRGEVNTPANLPLIAKKIAQIWQTGWQEVVDQTLKNTQKLFKL